jgi:hypothetical protein
MRSKLLSGLAALTLIAAAAPAMADSYETGGVPLRGSYGSEYLKGQPAPGQYGLRRIGPAYPGSASNTVGGGNVNLATGKYSLANQGVTTLGGNVAGGYGKGKPGFGSQSNTFGGGNLNWAYGKGSIADQSITTIGGNVSGRRPGASNTVGGYNFNGAFGKDSLATQQVVTVGGNVGH